MGELVGIFFYYSKIKILIRKKTTIFNFSVLSDHKPSLSLRSLTSGSDSCTRPYVWSFFPLHTTIGFLFSLSRIQFHFFVDMGADALWPPSHNRTKNSLFSKYFLIWALYHHFIMRVGTNMRFIDPPRCLCSHFFFGGKIYEMLHVWYGKRCEISVCVLFVNENCFFMDICRKSGLFKIIFD
jgi:hypothetical protein